MTHKALPIEISLFQELVPIIHKVVLEAFNNQNYQTSQKSDNSIVTTTDKQVDEMITAFIQKNFPEDQIISEEVSPEFSNINKSSRTWFIDPICGTRNFSTGVKIFTTNIALWQGSTPIFSMVFDYLEETYYWMHDKHQVVMNRDIQIVPEKISKPTFVLEAGTIQHKGNEEKLAKYVRLVEFILSKNWNFKRLGSSLDATYAAIGKYSAYVCLSASPWDFAAAAALMHKNGGVLSTVDGAPYSPFSKSLCMSHDKKLQAEVLSVLKRNYDSHLS